MTKADAFSSARTLVAIATYNEKENLPSLVDAVREALPNADILVIDDKSPDGTGEWADERAALDAHFSVLHREGKLGLGSAAKAAIGYAIQHDYQVMATLDADWSHPPAELPSLIALLSEAEVAIGSRYCTGGKIEGWPLRRRIVSRVVNGAARWLLRLPTSDSSGAFRAYRVEALRKIDLESLKCKGYAYLEEILWLLKRTGARLGESPITFTERRAGKSKINVREAALALGMMIRLGCAEWFGLGRS